MEFEVGKTYRFRNEGTDKTTDCTITRIENGFIYWKVPQSKGEFMGDIEWFGEWFERDGIKEEEEEDSETQ